MLGDYLDYSWARLKKPKNENKRGPGIREFLELAEREQA